MICYGCWRERDLLCTDWVGIFKQYSVNKIAWQALFSVRHPNPDPISTNANRNRSPQRWTRYSWRSIISVNVRLHRLNQRRWRMTRRAYDVISGCRWMTSALRQSDVSRQAACGQRVVTVTRARDSDCDTLETPTTVNDSRRLCYRGIDYRQVFWAVNRHY